MVDGENFFDQPVKNDKGTSENINCYSSRRWLREWFSVRLYLFQKIINKMIPIDLSKQQALDSDPRAIQQISFTANLDRAGNTRFYFILEEANETVFAFSQRTVKVL